MGSACWQGYRTSATIPTPTRVCALWASARSCSPAPWRTLAAFIHSAGQAETSSQQRCAMQDKQRGLGPCGSHGERRACLCWAVRQPGGRQVWLACLGCRASLVAPSHAEQLGKTLDDLPEPPCGQGEFCNMHCCLAHGRGCSRHVASHPCPYCDCYACKQLSALLCLHTALVVSTAECCFLHCSCRHAEPSEGSL